MRSRTPTTPRPVKKRNRSEMARSASLMGDFFAFVSAFGLTLGVGVIGYVAGNALDRNIGGKAGAALAILIALGFYMLNAFRGRPNDVSQQHREQRMSERSTFRRAVDTITSTFPRLRRSRSY